MLAVELQASNPQSSTAEHDCIEALHRLALQIQAGFNALAATLSGENAHFAFSYDESLSHLIYAGCDIILVPSIFEPCGLTQVQAPSADAIVALSL